VEMVTLLAECKPPRTSTTKVCGENTSNIIAMHLVLHVR
jgi:hypothetical protein